MWENLYNFFLFFFVLGGHSEVESLAEGEAGCC